MEQYSDVTTVTGTQNSTSRNFTLLGNYSDFYKYILRCEANDTTGNSFSTSNISFIVSLRNFSGYVKNFTDNVTGANVSIYRFIENMTEPPIETLVASGLTSSIGNFSITNVNKTQTRTCTDLNDCGTTVNKPTESQDYEVGAAGIPVGWPIWSYAVIIVVIVIIIAIIFTQRKKIFPKKKPSKQEKVEYYYSKK